MIAVKAQCDGYAGLNASSAASAASLCQARASVLCQVRRAGARAAASHCSAGTLPTASASRTSPRGAVQATDSGTECSLCTTLLSAYTELAGAGALAGPGALVELCYSVAQWDGGSADSLRQQLQWRFGCSPSESACCAPLPGDSFLAASLGIRGLTPQTTSNCEEQPGCTAGAYCWPSWGADTCQSLSGAAACQANRQCQVGGQPCAPTRAASGPVGARPPNLAGCATLGDAVVCLERRRRAGQLRRRRAVRHVPPRWCARGAHGRLRPVPAAGHAGQGRRAPAHHTRRRVPARLPQAFRAAGPAARASVTTRACPSARTSKHAIR